MAEALPFVKIWNVWAHFIGQAFDVFVGAPNVDELFGMTVGQGTEQDGVDSAEDGDGCADAEGHDEEDDGREAGHAAEDAEFVFEIVDEDGCVLFGRSDSDIGDGFEPETPARFGLEAFGEELLHFDAVFVAEFGWVTPEQGAKEFSLA